MVLDPRIYEVVLYGATGYTGQLCAEHITKYLPTNLTWAIAGRNAKKLQGVVDSLTKLDPDRKSPEIIVANHERNDCHDLAKKTRVVITTIGPYSKFGEVMLEACAVNGTHYLDCTGESPWVYKMVQDYHEIAKKNGAMIIPQCGIESVPADLITYVLAKHIRKQYSLPTRVVTNVLNDAKAGASGGTLSSVLAVFEVFSLNHLRKSMNPFAMSPIAPNALNKAPPASAQPSLLNRILGINYHPSIDGPLTDSPQGAVDRSAVYRSWGLLSEIPGSEYGPSFHFAEYMRSKSLVKAIGFHFGLLFAGLFLAMPPVRWMLKNFIFIAPGSGPDPVKSAQTDFVEYKAFAEADSETERKTATARMFYKGSLYGFTGVVLAEAAFVLARPEEKTGPCEARKLGGGVLTTACLGEEFAERLAGAENVTLEVE